MGGVSGIRARFLEPLYMPHRHSYATPSAAESGIISEIGWTAQLQLRGPNSSSCRLVCQSLHDGTVYNHNHEFLLSEEEGKQRGSRGERHQYLQDRAARDRDQVSRLLLDIHRGATQDKAPCHNQGSPRGWFARHSRTKNKAKSRFPTDFTISSRSPSFVAPSP